MGQDARVRYTKTVIRKAFFDLLKDTPLEKITVKKICELAQINRSTFYKYYYDVYDLFDNIKQDILIRLKNFVSNIHADSSREIMLKILGAVKSESETFEIICSENGDLSFPSAVFDVCYSHVGPKFSARYPQLNDSQKQWLYHYISVGCSGVLRCWFESGMKETPEELCDFLEVILNNTLSFKQNTFKNGIHTFFV
ncbi:MAG: TetR/AcrR family transcriptional regulator [Clostridia bacterium]|nr:TetR/AcrR family transcriptional regulator [Clostridia bacterium]